MQSSNETYNGWSNRETWLVNLWLTNDESIYRETIGMSANDLESFVHILCESEKLDGFLSDLIELALVRVNWRELAESMAEA